MGIAAQDYSGDGRPDLFVTNNRGQGHAAFRTTSGSAFADVQGRFEPRVGTDGSGWGVSWVDLGEQRARGPRARERRDPGHEPDRRTRADPGRREHRRRPLRRRVGGRRTGAGPLVNGRGVAAADYDNDGRVDVAINSIGGKLILLHNTGASGHWLEVSLAKFAPGAVVTAVLPDGRASSTRSQAGSSYLSSGPARPLRPRRRDEGQGADRPLARRQGHATDERAADQILRSPPGAASRADLAQPSGSGRLDLQPPADGVERHGAQQETPVMM